MTAPTDFSSFAYGFDLTSANYSGGAGGTFANLVTGGEDWVVNGATPSFSTKSGSGWSLDGMDFSDDITQTIWGENRAMEECTVLAIAQSDDAVFTRYAYGGSNAVGNTFGMGIYSKTQLQAYANAFGHSSGYATGAANGSPSVFTCSWCPRNGTLYAQINDGAPTSAAAASGSFRLAAPNESNAAIGLHRTTPFLGWIARVLVFSRALHYRDNTNLQSLITTEMAKIGL